MSTNKEKVKTDSNAHSYIKEVSCGEQYQRVMETHRALKSMREALGGVGDAGESLISYLQNERKIDLTPEFKAVHNATLEIAKQTEAIIAAHDRLYFLWVDGADPQNLDRSLN